MNVDPMKIATEYMKKYETAYAKGASEVVELYRDDGVLLGFRTAVGKSEIKELLQAAVLDQGWTKITIKVLNARMFNEIVVAVCDYSALGSGVNEGKTLSGRSSHVLVNTAGAWLNAMHSVALHSVA
jgi:hypothetical protein